MDTAREEDLIDLETEVVQDAPPRPQNIDDLAPSPPTPFSIRGRAAYENRKKRMATLKKKDALRKATKALHEYANIMKQLEEYQARAQKIWEKKIIKNTLEKCRLDTPIKPVDPHAVQRYKYLRYMVIREVTLEHSEYSNNLKKDSQKVDCWTHHGDALDHDC